ncbi:MAG: argininosuccinate lyase [Verrucomicrobiota bacterium]
MWKGRFEQNTADSVLRLGESISFDWRLYRHDIKGSIAHARAQSIAGILTAEEFSLIEAGLNRIAEKITAGDFKFSIALEDIHLNIESALTQDIGPTGAKLHTARSRNDQVATSTRLYCREEVDNIDKLLTALQIALLSQAEKHTSDPIPGYTHLQRGQPVTVGHHLLAYVEMLSRDKSRLSELRKRINICPLGSGALAGSTINLDREAIAKELGFDSVTPNSMDAISDRDYLAELLFALSLIGTHLSRLSEDLILWSSAEFQFVTLSDAHTTGSSLMPQKKNPDVSELTRGKSGRLVGNLFALLTAVKGLPLTYNRDLQEDKEPLFDSIDTISLLLEVNAEMIEAMTIQRQHCLEAASDPMLLATDLADWLVLEGIPFRHAHELVGKAVAKSVETDTPLDQLDLPSVDPAFKPEASRVFNLERALRARTNPGAPSPQNVAQQIQRWKQLLTN